MKRHVRYLVLAIAAAMALSVAYAEVGPAHGAVADSEESADTEAGDPGRGPEKTEKGNNGKGKGNNGKKKSQLTTTTTTTTTTTIAAEETPTTTTLPVTTTTTTTTTLPVTTSASTTTTSLPTTTTTSTSTTAPSTTTTSSTTTTTPPDGPVEWVSPEGVTIIIDSAGGWTVERVHQILVENALDLDVIGPTLTIRVQDRDFSSTTAGVAGGPGGYYNFSATMHLNGVTSFADKPDAILAHEFGHAWSLYHLYMTQQGDWSAWLEFRGIAGDPRLDTTYPWSKTEMIAEDYRLLFSSPTALAQWPGQMNSDIPDARDVPGLADFLENVWGR